jgi:hypothetical protein
MAHQLSFLAHTQKVPEIRRYLQKYQRNTKIPPEATKGY